MSQQEQLKISDGVKLAAALWGDHKIDRVVCPPKEKFVQLDEFNKEIIKEQFAMHIGQLVNRDMTTLSLDTHGFIETDKGMLCRAIAAKVILNALGGEKINLGCPDFSSLDNRHFYWMSGITLEPNLVPNFFIVSSEDAKGASDFGYAEKFPLNVVIYALRYAGTDHLWHWSMGAGLYGHKNENGNHFLLPSCRSGAVLSLNEKMPTPKPVKENREKSDLLSPLGFPQAFEKFCQETDPYIKQNE